MVKWAKDIQVAQLLRDLHHQVPAFWSHLIPKSENKTSLHVEMYKFILQKPKNEIATNIA